MCVETQGLINNLIVVLLNNLLMVPLINLGGTRSRKACGQHVSYVVDAGPCCLEDNERLRGGFPESALLSSASSMTSKTAGKQQTNSRWGLRLQD